MSGDIVACRHPTCHSTFNSQASMLEHYTHSSHSTTSTTQPADQLSAPAAAAADQFHPCDLCPRFFKSKGGLRNHLRAFHLIDDEDLPILPVAPAVLPHELHIQEVSCNECGRTFKTTDALHQHQWATPYHTHVAESPNPNHGTLFRKCSQCDSKLPTAEDLDQHFVEQHPISEVSEVLHDEGTWQLVEGRFRVAWRNPTKHLYKVHRIFKVYNPGWRRRDFEEYRKELKRQMSDPKMVKEDIGPDLGNKIRSSGNELYRYHGTTVKCKLGRPAPKVVGAEKEALSLCSATDCSLCRILQKGFMREKCRINRFQRYGKGIYCSGCSNKASDYVKCTPLDKKPRNRHWFLACFRRFLDWLLTSFGSGNDANLKVMMVCRVLAGRPYHTTFNLKHLTRPPMGFDSVQGDTGDKLNYDELVIYNDHAILPAYIILYTSSD